MDIIEILLVVVVCCFWGMFILWWITHLRYKSLLMDYKSLLDKHHAVILEDLKFSRKMIDHFNGNGKPCQPKENSSQLPLFTHLAGIGIVLHQKAREKQGAGNNPNDVEPKQADGDDRRDN